MAMVERGISLEAFHEQIEIERRSPEAAEEIEGIGLAIKTVTGLEFERYGPVKLNYYTDIYYCDGRSWPSEIVVKVLKSYEDSEMMQDERGEFVIDTPGKANWAVQKIKEERKRRDLFIQAAWDSIDQLKQQVDEVTSKCDNDTSFLLLKLSDYLDTVPAKRSKTQMSFDLPAGKLVKKLPQIEYKRDEERLLEHLRESGPELIKTKESIDWMELKKDLSVRDGVVLRQSTGEIVEAITPIETPERFDVE